MAILTDDPLVLPAEPIDRLINPIRRFLRVEAASGIVLLVATVAALVLANTRWAGAFLAIWKTPIELQVGGFEFRHSLKHIINDGLMAIFFFVIGLEVKRELVIGQLRDLRRAAVPVAAALGGMAVPAAIYLVMLRGHEARAGWGIPMATDIAFVVGCMALLGKRVPHGLRVLLLSLAIADDIGAIIVIALGYTTKMQPLWLGAAAAGIILMFAAGKVGVRSLLVYLILGVLVWFACHESGVHATLAGVLVGLITPAHPRLPQGLAARFLDQSKRILTGDDSRQGSQRVKYVRHHLDTARELVSPVDYMISILHPWCSFVIIPIFALANAGVTIVRGELRTPVAMAVWMGLFFGKPIGIFLVTAAAVGSGIGKLPQGVRWLHILGGGMLSGIGFTMAIFVASLALDGEALDTARVGVLFGSLVSGIAGMLVLRLAGRRLV